MARILHWHRRVATSYRPPDLVCGAHQVPANRNKDPGPNSSEPVLHVQCPPATCPFCSGRMHTAANVRRCGKGMYVCTRDGRLPVKSCTGCPSQAVCHMTTPTAPHAPPPQNKTRTSQRPQMHVRLHTRAASRHRKQAPSTLPADVPRAPPLAPLWKPSLSSPAHAKDTHTHTHTARPPNYWNAQRPGAPARHRPPLQLRTGRQCRP